MSDNVSWHAGSVDRAQRQSISGTTGCTIWLTGLSGSGKSTIAYHCEAALVSSGRLAYTLDGDNIRHGLNSDLGFSPRDRHENVRRVGEVSRLIADAGVTVLAPLISPYAADRNQVRQIHEIAGLAFYEVHVATPLEVCEQRDQKGLYARARTGELEEFTGISAPYEEPINPDLRIDTAEVNTEEAVVAVLGLLSLG
ncbi:MAG: adenylyl-sulfate kinase [Acidimicrobiia bacterium]|nr:adenylyl-sulfate kinase [Acidimicrobiia bacterium]